MDALSNTNIYPCIWFDGNAKEAFEFYGSIFPDSAITDENPIVIKAHLDGTELMGLNGGPMYKPNPSISFMWISHDDEAISRAWEKLTDGGSVLMELNSYPWSARYGWVQDKFGVNWQLYYDKDEWGYNKIVPTLMFGHTEQGKCREALAFYEKLFPVYEGDRFLLYEEGEMKGQVQHTQFTANNFVLMAMDSGVPQTFTFTEGVSLVVECDDQQTIDYYWNGFTKGGQESMCGWCKDPFGVSWQVVPKNIDKLLFNASNAQKAQEALMQMRKIEVAVLENAR